MNLTLLSLTLVFALCLPVAANTADPQPPANVPGGVLVVDHNNSKISFEGRDALYVGDKALIAIPINTSPGTHNLQVISNNTAAQVPFSVVGKTFTEQHITIENKAMVNPPPETLARIRQESAQQKKLYANYASDHDLSTGFAIPLQGIRTSLFGHRRFFNGQPRSPHSGLDIAAERGTPIAAAGKGTITLAQDLYFNGNTVFIDHGQGLVTMYCHMSEISVRVGQVVEMGETIGLVGTTGRSTGPHLHWSVSLAGYRIDPELFMRELNAVVNGASYGAQ